MTASVNIKRGDLHLAVSTAFNRGRYVLMTGGGDGQPIEITIDLRERPDDLFEAPTYDLRGAHIPTLDELTRGDIGKGCPFEIEPVTDDHGPSVPAQGEHYREPVETGVEKDSQGRDWRTYAAGPRVYEFALQDINSARREAGLIPLTLDLVELDEVHGERAAAADWVHVYDRVTRERRTLKRPEPDAVLTGLRDVAADLRTERGKEVFTPARGAPVEPPLGCAALPPVGPLTSTEGLWAGDVLRVIEGKVGWDYGPVSVSSTEGGHPWPILAQSLKDKINARFTVDEVAFVGRPDADGWMAWAGGENPVPGARVEVDWGTGPQPCLSDDVMWDWQCEGNGGDILRFRIVDTPPAV